MERVLVIGATSGIGRALAGRLAASGCRVGIVGRRAEPLTERDSDPSENPFFQAAADVTDPAAAVAVLERLVQRMGGMDLCLVAAGAGELNPELDYALELPAIRTNVVGWTAVVDWAYGYFERQGRGHLAVITSVGGLRGSCAAPAYNASKAAVKGLTVGMAASYAADNITVNSIGPGLFESEMTENTLFRHEAFMQMYDTLTPASRPGAKGELNGTILYFSSQASSYVTGQHIIVDGGFSIV